MKLGLIITNDWELFGDGSGNFDELQYAPLLEWLEIFGEYNAKFTLMAEVLQQREHIKKAEKYPELRDIADKWENAVIKSTENGHDVQLHLHPQWLGAEYESGRWTLDMDNWSVGRLPYEKIKEFLTEGKDYLENLIRPMNPGYECFAFRAGAYCVEPSANLVKALLNTNMECDTSVTKGISSGEYYDFTDAYSNLFPWNTTSNDLKYRGNSPLVEMPVYSHPGFDFPALKKLFPYIYYPLKYGMIAESGAIEWEKLRDSTKEVRYPRKNRFYKQKEKRNFQWYINAIISSKPVQLDYDYIPAKAFVSILQKLFNSNKLKKFRNTELIIPVVASGHMKDMPDQRNIREILRLIRKNLKDKIIYLNLYKGVKYYQNTLRKALYE